jgi:fluoroquinolone resistance protein
VREGICVKTPLATARQEPLTLPLPALTLCLAMEFDSPLYSQEKFTSLALTEDSVASVKFDECTFIDCRFIEVRFDKCAFVDCVFHDSVLSAIRPVDTRFLRPRFVRCKVIGFDWAKAGKLENLDFEESQLDYSNFSSLRLGRIRMDRCSAREVRFIEADMSEGVFTGTDFTGSTFFKSNLTRADFRRARNYSIDIRNNTVKNARFSLPEALSLLEGLEITVE